MRGHSRPLRRSLRMTPLLALAIATASLAAVPLCAAEVYKTVDAEGHVVYTDHADPNASKTTVQVHAMSAKQAAGAAKLQATQKADDLQHRKEQALQAAKIAKLDHDAKMQCDEAQKNFYAMKASERLFHQDSAGNRVYYSDAEAAMKREEARRIMVLACTD